ncbi:hypothetical protein [Gracilimonas mengyeensis]|uniref:Outer membrane protein beta-barrel domain-containing protein n=1 Tax=Gracilimonas mengyeensis TaxID=1302730 RepID=A0A521F4U8_9BACT|nr:hypothetical protein [Gracilimonas mengyeensis]SMO91192.1 hypothetical protein SAMN06265219_11548 [Gracilimonas mengyeensis]
MGKSRITVIALLLVIFSLGCTADVYLSNSHNIPLLEEKGDLVVNGGLNYMGVENNPGLGFNAAYAITDNLGVGAGGLFLNYSHLDETHDIPIEDVQEYKYGELSVIYYLKPKSFWRAELLGTAGIGKGKAVEEFAFIWDKVATRHEAEDRFYKLALQSNVGIGTEYFNMGLAPSLAYVDFYDYSTNQISFPSENTSAFFLEHSFFVRFGVDPIKLDFQVSNSKPLRKTKFYYDTGITKLGLNIKLDQLFGF